MIKKTLLLLIPLMAMLLMLACESSDPIDEDPPAIPSGLTVDIDLSLEGEIYVTWDENTDDAVGYNISRSSAGMGQGFAQIGSTTDNFYRDTGLDYDSTYYYRVNAYDDNANVSDWSGATDGDQPFNQYPPDIPMNLTIVAQNTFDFDDFAFVPDIELAWSQNGESDLDIYRIYRVVGNAQFVTGPDNLHDSTVSIFYQDAEVTAGTSYSYKITAVDKGGLESHASARVFDTPLIPPELIEPIGDATTSSLTPDLKFGDVYGADHYIIVVEDESDAEMWSFTVDSDGLQGVMTVSYAGTALSGNTPYDWYIKAYSKPPVDGLAINVETHPKGFRTP